MIFVSPSKIFKCFRASEPEIRGQILSSVRGFLLSRGVERRTVLCLVDSILSLGESAEVSLRPKMCIFVIVRVLPAFTKGFVR